MVSPCLNLCKTIWFKNTGLFCRKTPTLAVRKHSFCQSGGLVGRFAAKTLLAALYAAGSKAVSSQNMGLSCAEINDAAAQHQDR
jgi:hypothetical protein